MHQLIGEEYIGRPFHSKFCYLAGYGRSGNYGWRFNRQRANGILADAGTHMIDLARMQPIFTFFPELFHKQPGGARLFLSRSSLPNGRSHPISIMVFRLKW